MKNQQQTLIHVAGLVTLLSVSTSTALARTFPVTVQNDASNPVPVEVLNNHLMIFSSLEYSKRYHHEN